MPHPRASTQDVLFSQRRQVPSGTLLLSTFLSTIDNLHHGVVVRVHYHCYRSSLPSTTLTTNHLQQHHGLQPSIIYMHAIIQHTRLRPRRDTYITFRDVLTIVL